jgi:hypothetical protein
MRKSMARREGIGFPSESRDWYAAIRYPVRLEFRLHKVGTVVLG